MRLFRERGCFKVSKLNVKLTRRKALKIGALTAAAVAVGVPLGSLKVASVQADETKESKPIQLGFSYDQGKCIGCRRCVLACNDYYKWEPGAEWRKFREKNTQKGPLWLSMSCNHCANPACLKVCPVAAYIKRDKDGIVIQDPNKCVGCAYCTYACPYHAPQLVKEGTGAVTKCNFCFQLQDEGKTPICVAVCPVKALRFGDLEEIKKTEGAIVVAPEIEGLPPKDITNPSFVVIPKALKK